MSRAVLNFARRSFIAAAAAGLVIAGTAQVALAAGEVTVFAAASLTDVMKAAAASWQAKGNGAVVMSFGSSSTVAKQVEAGAPRHGFKLRNHITDIFRYGLRLPHGAQRLSLA